MNLEIFEPEKSIFGIKNKKIGRCSDKLFKINYQNIVSFGELTIQESTEIE